MDNIEKNNIDSEQEIDLKDIIKQLWRSRRFIFIVVIISLFIGLFIALTAPVSYTASTTIVPQTGGQDGLGRLAGFTNMMGVNLGGTAMVGEVLSPAIYPRIVRSVPFTKEIMTTPIVVERSNGVPITLYEYYTNARYRPRNISAGIKRYTIGLPGVILSALRSNNNDDNDVVVYTDDGTGEIISLTGSECRVIEIIRGNMQIEHNARNGYVILGYTFGEPEAVAVITQQMFRTLERYITDFMVHRQMENLQFVEASYAEARAEFLQSHANLAAFLDANRALSTVAARTQERLLSNEYELAVAVYRELARQREQTRLAVKESTPVLTVIEPVVVPHQRSAPRRSMILAVFLFLGVTVGIGWVLVKPFFGSIVREIREDR